MELTPEIFGYFILGVFVVLIVGPAVFGRKKKRRRPQDHARPYDKRRR